jgi:hypothetical protein
MVAVGLAASGCSHRPSRIQAIDVNPDRLSGELMTQLDDDGNGELSESELKGFPPIYDTWMSIDSDGSGEVSKVELTARFQGMFHSQIGLLPARCRVTSNGHPLAGAIVRFVPPKVLEGVLPPASGVTDQDGTAPLRLAPEDMPDNIPNKRMAVMRPGIYLVEVTHPDIGIPEQYNTNTTLGKMVYSDALNGPPLPIKLKL